jgi:hypothetical protein
LDAYFATGTEGICWSIFKDDPSGHLDPYDRLYPLDDGDDLIIFSDNKDDILWAGHISWEFKTNLMDQHPLGIYPGGKQAIDGYWVNGFPRSYNGDPKTWLSYFLEEYPAVCYKPSLNNGP